jgi:hypothetical protein
VLKCCCCHSNRVATTLLLLLAEHGQAFSQARHQQLLLPCLVSKQPAQAPCKLQAMTWLLL